MSTHPRHADIKLFLPMSINVKTTKLDIGLKKVLTSLPTDDAKLIDLAYFKGFTQVEISKAMMIPVETVKDRMSDSIRYLKHIVLSQQNISSLSKDSITSSLIEKKVSVLTPIEKMDIVRTGISKEYLSHLQQKIDLDFNQLSKILSVTKSQLANKESNERFDSTLSERILAIADLYSYGYEVFEDEDSFNKWVFASNKALGDQIPYNIMDNQFGREEIRNLIVRID